MIVEDINGIKKRNNGDKKISMALMAYFLILTIQYVVLSYFNLIGTQSASQIQIISKAMVGLFFLYALPVVVARSRNKLIASYFIAIFLFMIHYALFSGNRMYIKDILVPFFSMNLPAFVYSISIKNFMIFKEIMKKTSDVILLFGFLLGILIFTGKINIGTYSMPLSYYMLLPAILSIDELFNGFSAKKLVYSVFSIIFILALGSRGAILCIVVFFGLKLIKSQKKRTFKSVLLNYSLLSLLAAVLIFLHQLIEYAYKYLMRFGIRSRTLMLFLQDRVYLSGREQIYSEVIDNILKNPFIGIGLAGDRKVLDGGYVHNIFIEIIGNFGIVFGICISLILIASVIKSLLIKNDLKFNIINI